MPRPRFILVACLVLRTAMGAAEPSAPEFEWSAPGKLVFADEISSEERGGGMIRVDPAADTEEGLLIRRDGERESRRLIMSPPSAVDTHALQTALPRSFGALWRGEPFTLLAIGDSVTATGPYPEILARLLERTTGNRRIRVLRAAYPGKGADAAVRRWELDAAPTAPDCVLVMFGLNDQGAGAPVEVYLDQMRHLAQRIRDAGADAVFLEPTPHINITPHSGGNTPASAEAAIFRTAGFAAALRTLGHELRVPVAPTFDALWGDGAPSLPEAARRLWPLYPKHHRQPFTSLLESAGTGDTIHPNALGHLALARAVFEALTKRPAPPSLRFRSDTRWMEGRLESRIVVSNHSDRPREGRLDLYPWIGDDRHDSRGYSLMPGESAEFTFVWPVTASEELLLTPAAAVFSESGPSLQVVDYHAGKSRVQVVAAPWRPEMGWQRERSIVEAGDARAIARLRIGDTMREIRLPLPFDAQVGRIPLCETVERGGASWRASGELAFVRYARAATAEATVDGDLTEWSRDNWVPVGEPSQARVNRGPQDFRAEPGECYLWWSIRAGARGLYLAFRAAGRIDADRLTIYFDPRPASALGTVGPFFWIDGRLKVGGDIALRPGDSSPTASGMRGAWRAAQAEGEIFVPYEVMDRSAWPEGGDLGLSIIWWHQHSDGRLTRLNWSENGYPWSPLWFGVVRRGGRTALPWVVHVR